MNKPGRNDACPCGSGKKYKQCCLRAEEVASTASAAAPRIDIPALLKTALAHHQAGRLEQAEALYQQILQREPNHADALHLLGVIVYQSRQYVSARELIERAIRADSRQAAYYSNLGNVLTALGESDAAAVNYRKALLLNSSYSEAHYNLGNILLARGEYAAAAACYQDALRDRPDYPEAHNNLGNAWRACGKLEAAIACFKTALSYRADYVDAHNNLANIYKQQGNIEQAVAHYRQAITIQPMFAETYFNLGVALEAGGEFDAAADQYAHAITLKPDYASAHNNLGRWLASQGRLADAIQAYQRALLHQPDHVEAHNNWGVALQEQGLFGAAIEHHRRALQLEPDYALAHFNLGNAWIQQGHTDAGIACYRQALAIQADNTGAHNNLGRALASQGNLSAAYSHFRTALQLDPDFDVAHSNLLFHLNYDMQLSPEYCLREVRAFGERVEERAQCYETWKIDSVPQAEQKLRIGFVSGDLRAHPVGFFFESVAAHLDPERFELVAYVTKPGEDAVTARLKPYFAQWHTLLGLSDEAAARKIHEGGVDILVDLAGHTADNRLPVFAWKPAPVQVAWLGYFASTGMSRIDYIIGDPQVLPQSEASHFVEQPWRLPDCYLCFTPPQDKIEVGGLPMLAQGHVTFGCFNQLPKMNDAVVALWSRVLEAVPGSRLLLKAKELTDASARQLTQARFSAHGIEAERLELEGHTPRADYLVNYRRVDIALDPFPYPGGTTTAEALWMGVPVLSRRGGRFLAHAGESLLGTAGLGEWVAADAEDYVKKARAYAADVGYLAGLRARLRGQLLASPLCDAPRFAANLGDALNGMWQRYLQESGEAMDGNTPSRSRASSHEQGVEP